MMGPGFAAGAVAEMLRPVVWLTFSLIVIVVLGFGNLMYNAVQSDNQSRAYQERCMEAGGYAVIPYPQLKSKHNGQVCINPSAIIQLKDEK